MRPRSLLRQVRRCKEGPPRNTELKPALKLPKNIHQRKQVAPDSKDQWSSFVECAILSQAGGATKGTFCTNAELTSIIQE